MIYHFLLRCQCTVALICNFAVRILCAIAILLLQRCQHTCWKLASPSEVIRCLKLYELCFYWNFTSAAHVHALLSVISAKLHKTQCSSYNNAPDNSKSSSIFITYCKKQLLNSRYECSCLLFL